MAVKIDFIESLLAQLLQNFPCSIGRKIVDDDQFLADITKIDGFNPLQNLANGCGFVENRHKNC